MSAYSTAILDRAASPRYEGPLPDATHTGVAGSPGDGPYMEMWFELRDGVIRRAAYRTYGCPAAVACGSMTAQVATGRTIEQVLRLTSQDLALLLGGLPKGKQVCADLAVRALHCAFLSYTDDR